MTTCDSSFSFKTGEYDENGNQLSYRRQMRGYLRLGDLAMLLAAQLVLRGTDSRERRRILSALPANQASLVRDAHKQLSRERDWLLELLGLDEQELECEPRSPEDYKLFSLEEIDGDFIKAAWEDGEPAEQPGEAHVARAPIDPELLPKRIKPSLMLPVVLASIAGLAGAGLGFGPGIMLGALAFFIGFMATRFHARYSCARCGAEVFPDKDWCSGCDDRVPW